MYHSLVARIARTNFERVNRGDHDALLNTCAPDVHHRFGGDHALGGERHDREALRRWFERLRRLVPSLVLSVRDVWVTGLPHDTTVAIRWTAAATRPDGSPYENHGVHIVRMRWFTVVEIDANEDSQAVAGLMDALAAAGIDEAHAEPVTS